MPKVTSHAKKRLKQRSGISKGSADKIAARALGWGITHAQARGTLKLLMDALYLDYKAANNLRFYGGKVFIFHSQTLITVIPVKHGILDHLEDNVEPEALELYQKRMRAKRRKKVS